jgi:hypothetical protein
MSNFAFCQQQHATSSAYFSLGLIAANRGQDSAGVCGGSWGASGLRSYAVKPPKKAVGKAQTKHRGVGQDSVASGGLDSDGVVEALNLQPFDE